MNKKIIILIIILAFSSIGLIIFLIIQGPSVLPVSTTEKPTTSSPTSASPASEISQPDSSPNEDKEDKDEIKSDVLEQEFTNLLIPETKEYSNFFIKAQKKIDFPIKYPKTLLKDWGLKKITVWKGETQGITAVFTKKDKKFTLEEGTISFNVDYMSLPIELELTKNKKGYYWDLLQEDGSHQRILYFDYLKKDDIDFLYTIQSSDLIKEEMIEIANSILIEEYD